MSGDPTVVEYDEQKFAELLLYVASRMSSDPTFGATKLNKVLFYCDFFHYADQGVAITGAEYQRLRNGPAPRRLLPVQADLVASDAAYIVRTAVGQFVQKRLVPLREADLRLFSAPEIAYVEKIIDWLEGRTATAVSRMTHHMLAWKITEPGETIPYNAVFLYDGPLTEDVVLHAKQIAERLRPELANAGLVA